VIAFHAATIVLLILRVAHEIDWSWWIIFMPSAVGLALDLAIWFTAGFALRHAQRKILADIITANAGTRPK
jgi:hypothetical protein